MRTKVIDQGYHYPNPLRYFYIPLPKIIRKKKETITSCYISFNKDCLYDLEDEDQLDQNKLFGFSTSLNHHHNNSMRFTWKANLKLGKIDIFACEYLDGEKKYEFLRSVDIDEVCYFKITYIPMMLTTVYTIDKKTWDSPFIMIWLVNMPCLREFCAATYLPSGVLGPVDLSEF